MGAPKYSEEFKQAAVQKLLRRGSRPVDEIAGELGVSYFSLYKWAREYGTGSATMKKDIRPQDRSGLEKAALVVEYDKTREADRGEFLRKQGLHTDTIEEWRKQLTTAFAPRKLTQAEREEKLRDQKRIKELEKEVRRKDKALAETTALLVLAKKVQALWGSSEEDE